MAEPTLTTTLLNTAVAEGAKALMTKLLGNVIPTASSALKSVLQGHGRDLEPYMQSTFDRCCKIKTLINKSHPVDLLTIYENTSFICVNKRIDDYEFIELINTQKRIVICGTGGGGKTIFMKYLWLALFNKANGKIPVFIELRRTNDVTSDDLISFVYHSLMEMRSNITRKDFDLALSEGLFTLIFDGFDELSKDRKEVIEKHIHFLGISNNNIIVSGRFDSRFDAWQSFFVYQILPMDQKQVCSLIGKLDYDKVAKKRFIDRIKNDLYKKHESFLSNPLLATMMMLTFDQFADIPEKMFVFYDQAFDTLFLKHDATKEGYKREKKSGLPIDEFKKYLSYFCLLSYYEGRFEFTDSEMRSYISKTLEILETSVNSNDFLDDLTESICIVQREGLLFTFTHRSFQEYFTAYCLSNFIDEQANEIIQHIMLRLHDNVIPMIFDMNRERIERLFILPNLRRIVDDVSKLMSKFDLEIYAKYLQIKPETRKIERSFLIVFTGSSIEQNFLHLLNILYPDFYHNSPRADKEATRLHQKDAALIRKIMKDNGWRRQDVSSISFYSDQQSSDADSRSKTLPIGILKDSGLAEYCQVSWESSKRLLLEIDKRTQKKAANIESILKLTSSQRT